MKRDRPAYLGGEDVVGEDPGHGHLDGELNPLAHRHLQVELPVPQLGQVTAVLIQQMQG